MTAPSAHRVDFRTATDRSPDTRSMIRNAHQRIHPVALPEFSPSFHLRLGQSIFTIGSCFARNIETHLDRLGFRIPTLDFKVPEPEWEGLDHNGILNKYTPPSIYQEIAWTKRVLESGGAVTEEGCAGMFLECAAGVIDLQLGGFRPVSLQRAVERRAEVFRVWRSVFTCDCVTITLGLTEAWFDASTGAYIQQRPSITHMGPVLDRFRFESLPFTSCFDYIDRAVRLITAMNPAVRILVTTSPVHLQRTYTSEDILTANSFSKSKLRTVAGELAERHANVDYFPSYEMATLTKDWNIWESDLVHVSSAFVGRIVSRLLQAYVHCSTDEERAKLASHISAAMGDFEVLMARNRAAYEERQSANPAFGLSLAKQYHANGEYRKALDVLTPFTVLPDPISLRLAAECHRQLKDFAQSIAMQRCCVQLTNKFKPWAELIQTQIEGDHLKDAEESCRMALKRFPKIPVLHQSLIKALIALGRPVEAIEASEVALALLPGNELFQLMLARARIANGERDAAEALLRSIPTGSPHHLTAAKLMSSLARRPATASRDREELARARAAIVKKREERARRQAMRSAERTGEDSGNCP